ncbi:MAG: flavin monoamine oxidase family protein [Flammeovirgaceae bacterium]
MKRRAALKNLGLGLSAGVLAPQFFSACKKDDPGPEIPYSGNVIIIGAGAAGLYAADILRSKGIAVTVLEAGSQPGGRVRSLRNQTDVQYQTFSSASQADFPVELGSEVIFGSNSSWGKIVSDFSIATVDMGASASPYFILDGQAKDAAGWQGDSDFQAVQSFVSNLPNVGSGGSIKDAANVAIRAQALLNSQAGNLYGSSAENVGSLGVAQMLKAQTHDGKQLTVRNNPWQDVLISRFVNVLPLIKLNTEVKAIDWSGDVITVSDANGVQYTCTKLIVAVPLSILKSGSIAFTPALPSANANAMAKFGMDACIRLVLDFKKNFWGLDSSYTWGGTTVPQYFNSGAGRSQFFRTISLTINGPKAQQLSGLSDDNIVLQVLAEMDTIYNGQGTGFIRRDLTDDRILSLIKDWTKDPFIKGGISYPLVGTTNDDRKGLAASANDRLYFAGEATDATGDAGTVSGALNSAIRVTDEIIKSIVNP